MNATELFWGISENTILRRCLQEAFQPLVTMVARALNLKACSLMLIDEAKKELWICASHATSGYYLQKPNIKVWEGVSGRVMKEKRTVEISDVASDASYRFPQVARAEGLVSLLSAPVKIGLHVIGVLNGYTGVKHQFTDDEWQTFEAAANQTAMVVENEVLREENASLRSRLKKSEVVEQAKSLLMEKRGLNEDDAYKFLRTTSMEHQRPLAEVARTVIESYATLSPQTESPPQTSSSAPPFFVRLKSL